MPGSVASLVDLLTIDDDDELAKDEAYARRLQEKYDNEALDSDLSDDDEDDAVHIDIDSDAIDDSPSAFSPTDYPEEPFPERIELHDVTLDCGLVKIGDVVELKDESEIGLRTRQYGDFFLVKTIVENVQSEDLNLRGFRLRRCTRLSPLFDGKLNDLVLLMEVDRYDKRSHHVQGIVEVAVDAVVGKRVCHFTNLTYEQMGLRTTPTFVPALLARLKDAKAISDYVFRNGPLYCRWVHISIKEWNGKPYGGEVRRLYKRERDEFAKLSDITQTSRAAASNGDESDESDDFTIIENPQKRRSSSVESLDHDPRKRRPGIATKPMQLTFGDFFCCAGGASYGAVDAGLLVSYGVEIDGEVMESYRRNHPGATALEMDAHDFPSFASRSNFYVDHAHFSTTCKYFAICHTRPGKDDQMNFETIYVVGPILELLKPPYATAEQAPGMILLRKHKPAFRLFLNMILRAGFNVRYQVADLASHDLPQRRRRLLFNMSKIGFPLAPFPNPTCGPKGSGLKRYVTVADALEKLERIPPGLRDDPLHRPETLRRCNKEPYDPRNSLLKGCLTTSGGENYHYSGKRRNTARENSQFQTFPLSAHFNGSPSSATAQIGNAYPPSPASQHFLSNAQTREAFEHGFISDEEEIHDLWETLNDKGITIPKDSKQFRYLNRLQKNPAKPSYVPPSIWARSTPVEPQPFARRPNVELPARSKDRKRREVRAEAELAKDSGDMVWV